MNNRQRINAILHYKNYDIMPVVHFGYWKQTIERWISQGYITQEELKGHDTEEYVSRKLGFDFGWYATLSLNTGLIPEFKCENLGVTEDGFTKIRNSEGAIVLQKENVTSIPAEVGHTLKDRKSWEEEYLPRLKYCEERLDIERVNELKKNEITDKPVGLFCGSLYGKLRNYLGVEGISYLYVDDYELYCEMIDTIGDLSYKCVKKALKTGIKFDFAHFWEDICFKNGPLVVPKVFEEKVGPHYKKITDLLLQYGVDIVSLDCDGRIDALIPTWLQNGVNTMFPIEVGTWNASIEPWRKMYGKAIRGVGGMNKLAFAKDYKAIDQEIERLKGLVELGGFIPCPDHRIPPDSKWENVQYYCDKMHKEFA